MSINSAEILNQLLNHLGLNANKLSSLIGLDRPQALYDISKGKSAISRKMANRIASAFPEINSTWLLTGEGKMIFEDSSDKVAENATDYLSKRRKLKNEKEPTLMFYNVGARAGTHSSEILPVKKSEGSLLISDLFRGSDYGLRINGNSMIPNYPGGCIIGIREIPDKMITPGSVYVVEKDSDLWIKRLFYKNDDQESGYFQCVSDNEMRHDSGPREGKFFYPPFFVAIDDIRRLFKVTGVYKSNELTVIQ